MNMFEKPAESLEQQFEKGIQEIQKFCTHVREASAARAVEASAGVINDRESDIENDREAAFAQLEALLSLAEKIGAQDGEEVLRKKREEHATGAQTEMSLND